MRRLWTVLAALATLSLTNCGYNSIQTNDEQVKASWSEVLNQYQRRADLVPNLVATVKGYAKQEETVLREVTEARAHASTAARPAVPSPPWAPAIRSSSTCRSELWTIVTSSIGVVWRCGMAAS